MQVRTYPDDESRARTGHGLHDCWRRVQKHRDRIVVHNISGIVALIALTGIGCLSAAAETSARADFYIAADGDDRWSGTLPIANSQSSDGPFATLRRARDAVRELKRNSLNRDVLVIIRNGLYRLQETVVFGLQDSGKDDWSVTYAAYPGEKPVCSSGRQITGWKKVTANLRGLPRKASGNVWAADIPLRFFTLYDAEGLLPRARSAGFIPLPGGKSNVLRFPAGRFKNWPNLDDVEIVIRPHHAWIVNILSLASVDEKTQIVRTTTDGTYALNPLHFLKDTESCWVENVLEELDEPGEWVLDTKAGKLYLWPRSGDAPKGVMAPKLRKLIRVEGTIDKNGPRDKPVRNLCLQGLTFMHGDRYRVTDDDAGLQHDWEMHDRDSALIRLRGAENCTIEQCRFAHSGGGAIRVDLHGQDNRISGNLIEHIGGTGILLCGYGPGTKDVNKNNLVYNNHIHHTGEIYSHSPGVMIWQSGQNRVVNNLIHHTPYSGMIISGCMTHFFARPDHRELVRTIRWHESDGRKGPRKLQQVRPYLHTRDNIIEYNEIHHAMEKLGDGNGIYIRGAGAGNVIHRNYVHHLVAPMKMQAAIRTDGGQRDTLIAENLIYKCVSQGIILKLNIRCENNIVADVIAPPRGYCLSLREGPMTGAAIQRNIFYSSSKKCVFIDELPPRRREETEDRRGRELARSRDADTDDNIYFCAGDPALGQKMLKKQQRDGVDAHSQAVDPLFVDPANGDFRLKPESPALKLGFIPIDVSRIGLQQQK
ncbi:MAG TPA: right-handed parallel beta-helix repeat-containing protein [Planctomycetes bacterium]|nr:right-handed parallel beta-helix repeat-containing protein [Planctomycetota bacterium]